MNEYSTKQVQIVSLQPDYVSNLHGKTKNSIKTDDRFTAVRSVKQIVPNFRRKSFNVLLFPCLLEIFFSSFLNKHFYIIIGFYQTFTFKLNMVNFNM